jgi:F0F1-type ATP synthase assembly protein I
MSQAGDGSKKGSTRYAFNLVLVGAAGGAGCLTVLIILIALFSGLWLDNTFDTRPLFTIILMVGSVPITLVAMLLVVRFSTSRIKPPQTMDNEPAQEDA